MNSVAFEENQAPRPFSFGSSKVSSRQRQWVGRVAGALDVAEPEKESATMGA